jgi:hypothetical protein
MVVVVRRRPSIVAENIAHFFLFSGGMIDCKHSANQSQHKKSANNHKHYITKSA